MKKPIIIFQICLAILCVLSGCSKSEKKKTNILAKPPQTAFLDTNAPDAPIDFKVKWHPDQRYVFRLETVLGTDVNLPTTNQPQKYVLALGHNYSVLPGKYQPDGGQELGMELIAQRFFIQIAERNFLAFDHRQSAEQDAADPVSPILRKFLNAPIKCFIAADGKLSKTEGLNTLTENLNAGEVLVRDAAQKNFTEQNLGKMFAFLAATQPADPMKTGQSWPMHLESDGVVLVGHLKTAGWDTQDNRVCVRIEFQGDVSTKPGATNETNAVIIEGGTFSGKVWFDPQLGTLLNSSMVGHLTTKVFIMGQSCPARVNLTSNFRLLSLEEQ